MTTATTLTTIERGYHLSARNVNGATPVRIVGRGLNIGTSTAFVDVWGGSGLSGAVATSTISTSDNIDSIVSTSASDTAKVIRVEGVTIAGVEVTQDATLNGQTRVALAKPIARINRAYGISQTALAGIVSIYVNTTIASGVVTDTTKLRGVIAIGDETTLDGRYTVPAGKRLFIDSVRATNVRTVGTTIINSIRFLRRRGAAFDVMALSGINSSTCPQMIAEFRQPIVVEPGEDLIIRCDSSGTSNITAWALGVQVTI